MGQFAQNPTDPNHAVSLWDGDSMDPELATILKRMPETEKQTSRILDGWDDMRALIGGIARSLRSSKKTSDATDLPPKAADGDDGND
ncbi:MAG: hypothetical protein KF912_11475 [Phycisphaeraceae bacterium]|nr:hypothetical protein [Phycisphaeraceae bacterium]QYK48169.1 MAG: hypothetical protein KF838_15430 [Phycisphaeraceae bacterium]